jgi:uracil-DNA glycosylase family 4
MTFFREHETPMQREVAAYVDWLEAELAALKPVVIVALRATALAALLGHRHGVAAARAMTLHHAGGARIAATYHPSALLRAIDATTRADLKRALVADLRKAGKIAGGG